MPLLHCNKCHHEWEGRITARCAWCGAGGYVLEDKTPLEKSIEALLNFIMDTTLGGY